MKLHHAVLPALFFACRGATAHQEQGIVDAPSPVVPSAATRVPVPAGPVVAPLPKGSDVDASPVVDWRPRCEVLGGKCVGPAAIRANPTAPCPPGMHRVDDVHVVGAPPATTPACFGIRTGEEACCLSNPR